MSKFNRQQVYELMLEALKLLEGNHVDDFGKIIDKLLDSKLENKVNKYVVVETSADGKYTFDITIIDDAGVLERHILKKEVDIKKGLKVEVFELGDQIKFDVRSIVHFNMEV